MGIYGIKGGEGIQLVKQIEETVKSTSVLFDNN